MDEGDGVVQLLKGLRDRIRGEETPCRRLYDIRRELDVLLFEHLATSDCIVTDDGEYGYILRRSATLAYALREHKLVTMANGIEALVQNCLKSTMSEMMGILRFLLALAGGQDGTEFVECLLGPRAIQANILREEESTATPITNQRIGDYLVQDNIDLICNPQGLFQMPNQSISLGMNGMQAAFSMVPGTSRYQSDIWREELTRNVDMFGALHHTTFHRSDAKLQRFDIFMDLPSLDEKAPDMIQLAIEAASSKAIPKRMQISQKRCQYDYQSHNTQQNDSPDLLFSKYERTVHISLNSATNASDEWYKIPSVQKQNKHRTWEDLASHPSQVAEARRQITLGHSDGVNNPISGNDLTASKAIECVLLAIQGLENSLFGISHDTLSMHVLQENLRIFGEISSTAENWLKNYAILGTYVVRLQILASYCQKTCQLTISSSISTFLAAQQAYILNLQPKTIVELLVSTTHFRGCLEAFSRVYLCHEDELWIDFRHPYEFEKRPVLEKLPKHDSSYLDHLYNFVVFAQLCAPQTSNLYMWLFIHAATPYLGRLSRYFFLGEPMLNDDAEMPSFFTKHDGWKTAILDVITLLHLIHEINPQLYALSTSKWTDLKIDTDANDMQERLQAHASNLAICSDKVDAYKQTQLQELADAIIAIQEDRKNALSKNTLSSNEALHRKQLLKAQQQLQKQLLDEQIAAKSKYELDVKLKHDALEVRELQVRLEREKSKYQDDKKQLIDKYSSLLAKAEERHRYLTWRQARLRRKEMFGMQLERLYCSDASEWCQDTNIQLSHARPLDILWSKPLLPRQLNASTSEVSKWPSNNGSTVLSSNEIKEESAPKTHIKILNTSSRMGSEAASIIYGGTESSSERYHVRVTKKPGGGGEDVAAALNYDASADVAETSTIRHLAEPSGGGANAAEAIYHGAESTYTAPTTVRVLQEPGGGGSVAEAAIYDNEAALASPSLPSVKILQEPGGGGNNAAQAIYSAREAVDGTLPLIKVLNVPGGGGDEAHSLLYPDSQEVDSQYRPQTKVSQPPGGSGNDVRNMLYSSENSSTIHRSSVRISQDSMSNATAESNPEVSEERRHIRIVPAPGGDGEDMADLLYTQFSNLQVTKPSVKILQPSGGGHDKASKLIYGNPSPVESKPTLVQPQLPSKQLMDWRLQHPSSASFLSQTTEILHGPSSLLPDYNAMYEMYLELLGTEVMEHIPIDTLVEVNLGEPLQNYRAFIGKVALNALRDDMNLMEHLSALHDTMFLSGGLWVDIFIKEFVKGLNPLSERIQWGAPGVLNDAVSSAMQQASYSLPPAANDRFGYRTSTVLASSLEQYTLTPSLHSSVSQLDPIYQVPAALSVVLPESAMQHYSRIHRFGFYIKATLVLLREARSHFQSLFERSPSSPLERRRCDLYLFWQHHIASTLHTYIFQLIAEEWHRFQNFISTVSDTMALRDKHESFLKSIATRCFLTSSSDPIREAIEACLKQILMVCNQIQLCPKNSAESMQRVVSFILDEFAVLDSNVLVLCNALRYQRDNDGPFAVFVEELLLQLNLNEYYGSC